MAGRAATGSFEFGSPGLFTHFVAPLIIYLIKKDESEFVKVNAREALNFQITMIILFSIAGFASMFVIGILLFPVIYILDLVCCILGAMAANKGQVYRYPLSFRLIN